MLKPHKAGRQIGGSGYSAWSFQSRLTPSALPQRKFGNTRIKELYMTDIGFLGLGAMGVAMARRLIDSGHRVTVWNRSDGPANELVKAGAIAATAPEDAIANPIILSMLANDAAVESVFTSERLATACAETVHINMASISVAASERLRDLHFEAGIDYVTAPVLGRPNVAAAGQLTIVAGGSPKLIDAVRPVLDALGQRIWHVGEEPSSANLVKIAINYTIIHALQAMAEGVTLVEGGDVDPVQFIGILTSSLFPGPVYEGYGRMIAERQYVPAFNVTMGRKDLRIAQEAAAALAVELPTAPVLVAAFEAALADPAIAPLDWAAIAEITRARSGVLRSR
ncbi:MULTISPECIES: NAD(P)-dependent oxidoreductase [unclassified Paenarthrobacter]|uniref:NAD(P)-dependent oxidoreductase n=1 Tax=unclassified Paenarthrobacter TaxID=2634190 RepID=UPI00296F5A49